MATTVPVDESPAGVDPSAERTTSSVPAPLVLTKFFIYETIARVYIVGTDELQQRFRILKLGHSSAGTLQAHCDRTEYGAVEFQRLLLALHEGNAGGCKMVSEARGVVGTIRLLSTVFLVLVKQASCVGELGSHQVFRAEALDFFPLTHPDVGGERPVTLDDTEDIDTTIRHQSADEADVEAKYEALLRGIEAKDFIFSYTYALHLRMQHSFSGPASPYSRRTAGKPEEVAQDALLYVWNSYMLDQMDGGVSAATLEGRGGGAAVLLSSGFGLGLVCGSFHQRRVSLLGLPLCLTLLSRRSSEFAGTRFRKRGVNSAGFVANEVETEQIIHIENTLNSSLGYRYTSFVQLRGSIPLFWTQKGTKTDPIPQVRPGPADPDYTATAKHFDGLERRYGSPTICLNLVKSRGENREVAIGQAFREAVDAINLQREMKAQAATANWKLAARDNRNGERTDTTAKSSARPDRVAKGAKEAHPEEGKGADWNARSLPPIVWESQDLHHLAEEHSAQEVILMLGEMGSRLISETTGLFDTGQRAALSTATGVATTPAAASSSRGESAAGTPGRQGHCKGLQNQTGVIRTNCLDCLDRTTVAQFCVGMAALGLQLQRLGLREQPSLSFDDEKDVVLMGLLAELFKLTGHVIALQYGGSEAHLDMMRDGVSGTLGSLATAPGGVSVDGGWGVKLFKSFRRYYSNAFTDRDKQDALNLMLGKFAPWRDLISHGGAYRHIWEWNEDDGDEESDQHCDHFLHNPPLGLTKHPGSLMGAGGGLPTISSASSFSSVGSVGSSGGSDCGSGGGTPRKGVPTAAEAPSFCIDESPVRAAAKVTATAVGRSAAANRNRHRLIVDYKVLPDATDPGWVRFERLLSADWRKPVHVYANNSEYNSSNNGSVGGRGSMDDNASESQPLRSATRYDVDEADGLWRQSSAWIEQIGSDRLPPRASGSKNNAVVRSRERTESLSDDSTGWGTTPGTLRSIFFADSLGGNNGTDAHDSDGEGSRCCVVSAAALVRAGDLDVIARLQRPDVTEQVVAEMHAALSVSSNLLTAVFADERADERGGGTEEAMFFDAYVEGQRFVEEQAGASVIAGDGVSTAQPFALDRTDSAWSSVHATGYHDQLYFETYAEGGWLGGQHYTSSLDFPARQALTPEERGKSNEHERWRPGHTAKRSQQQRTGPRQEQSTVGGSAHQPDVATSDNSETKSRWSLPWAETGQPMPRWRSVTNLPRVASSGNILPSVAEGGTSTGSATGTRRLPGMPSPEAAIGAAVAQKHRLVRLRKERQQQLRQQQMQYAVDRDRMLVVGTDAGHKVMMTREEPCSLAERQTPRARYASYAYVATAAEAPDEPEGSAVAEDFFAAYLHRSMCDHLSGQAQAR